MSDAKLMGKKESKMEPLKAGQSFDDDSLNLLTALLEHSGDSEFNLKDFEQANCKANGHPNAEIYTVDKKADTTTYYCASCSLSFTRKGIQRIPDYVAKRISKQP